MGQTDSGFKSRRGLQGLRVRWRVLRGSLSETGLATDSFARPWARRVWSRPKSLRCLLVFLLGTFGVPGSRGSGLQVVVGPCWAHVKLPSKAKALPHAANALELFSAAFGASWAVHEIVVVFSLKTPKPPRELNRSAPARSAGFRNLIRVQKGCRAI